MTERHASLCIALILASSLPAFADRILSDPRSEDANFHRNPASSNKPASPVRFNQQNSNLAELVLPQSETAGTTDLQSSAIEINSDFADSIAKNDLRAWHKRKDKENGGEDVDGPLALVSTPEAGSAALLLCGLTALGYCYSGATL